jgi:polysaccharide biosynthesis protein PslJ
VTTTTIDSGPRVSHAAGAGPTGRLGRGAPVTIIQIYAVLLVLIPPTHIIGPLGAIGTPATVTGLVALMLWGVAVITPGDYLCRTVVSVRLVLGLLVGTIILGYAVLHVRAVPGPEVLGSDRALLQVLSWAGVGLLAAEGLRDRGELYRVLRTLAAAVGVMAVVGLLQFRFGIDLAVLVDRIPGLHENQDRVAIQDRGGFRRPAGTATHPIEFGCVVALTLPLALHLARFDLARSSFRRWLPVAAIAIGIPVAVSRSAVLGAAVGGVVVFMGLDQRLRPRALAAVAVFIVLVYATTPGLLGTFRNLFVNAGSDSSITYRTSDYEMVGEYIRQSPVLGRGPGTYLTDIYSGKILDNQYLLSAIEIGLVGLAIVIGYLLATAFLGRGIRHRTRDPAMRDLGQALAATSLAGAVAAFTFDGFSFLMFAGLVPLCLGVAGATWMMVRPAEHRIGIERPLGAETGDAPYEAPPVGAPAAPFADRPAEQATLRVEGVAPPAGPEVSDHVGATHHSDADKSHGADEELEWLTTSATEPLGIGARSSNAEARASQASDGGDDSHELRRIAVLVGSGVALAVLVALPFTIETGSEDADVAVAPIVTPRALTPVTPSTTTPTSIPTTTRASGTSVPHLQTTTAARPTNATTVRPLRTEAAAAASSQPSSLPSPSPPTPLPTDPTPTTTRTTVLPPPTTTTTTATTTTTTTTTTPTTTPTTPDPPQSP